MGKTSELSIQLKSKVDKPRKENLKKKSDFCEKL